MAVKNNTATGYLTAILIISVFLAHAYSQTEETLTITTYYPSPNGAFRDLEVKSKLIVGNISDSGKTNLNSMDDLAAGQMYAESIVLGDTSSSGTCNPAAAGTVLYNSNFKKMQFCDGTQWINASAQ